MRRLAGLGARPRPGDVATPFRVGYAPREGSSLAERRLAAIMFTDIVGYTALMAGSEEDGLRVRARHRGVLGPIAERHRGEIVDENGDELVLSFPSALDAASCALAVQSELRDEPALQLRIGIHLGDVVFEEGRVYGDGVNVASRIRPLAEPGGVCVSEQVYDSIKNQPSVTARSLGAQNLRNVARPVEVFALSGAATAPAPGAETGSRHPLRFALGSVGAALAVLAIALWATWPRPLGLVVDLVGLSGAPVDPPLPDKPSVVVLPFANLSGDPEQEYFSDGITEELINDLARLPELFVISRNSAFTYKGQAVNVRDVGRDLGVRYVIEGTVRKAEGQVRITAQLIDATSDFHLWSQSYDRELSDIFAIQSEISQQVLVALKVELRDATVDRWVGESGRDLKAQETVWRGVAHFQHTTRDHTLEARHLFERAIEQDPDFAAAYAFAALTYWSEYGMGWNLDSALLRRAEELARRALALDPSTAPAYTVLSFIHLGQGRIADAVAAAERLVELAPNTEIPHMVLGIALARQGRSVAAMQSVARAVRLSPKDLSAHWIGLGYIHFATGRTEKAVEIWEQARDANADLITARVPLAAVFEAQGRHDEARTLVREILRVNPELTAESAATLVPAGGPSRDELIDDLRSAGLP